MTVSTWKAKPVTNEPLALEIKKRSEHWINWDRSGGPVFLSDLPAFPDDLLRSFRSDTRAVLTSLINERANLKSSLRSLPPGSYMAARELQIKIKRATRKEECVRILNAEAANILKNRKIGASAAKDDCHSKIQKQESRKTIRSFHRVVERLMGERVHDELAALSYAFAISDLEQWAAATDVDSAVAENYIINCRTELGRRLDALGCGLETLKEKYGYGEAAP